MLNRYGTYKLPSLSKLGDVSKVPRYLKYDLADQNCCNAITLLIVDTYITLYESRLTVGSSIQVAGPIVKPKNCKDGGSS